MQLWTTDFIIPRCTFHIHSSKVGLQKLDPLISSEGIFLILQKYPFKYFNNLDNCHHNLSVMYVGISIDRQCFNDSDKSENQRNMVKWLGNPAPGT